MFVQEGFERYDVGSKQVSETGSHGVGIENVNVSWCQDSVEPR